MKNENIYTRFWRKFTVFSYNYELASFIPIFTVVYLFRNYWINVNESIWISILYTFLFVIVVSVMTRFLARLKRNLFKK